MIMTAASNASTQRGNATKRALSAERLSKLKLDQLNMVVQNIKPGVLGLPLLALTICFVLSQWVSIVSLAWWFAGVVGATAFYWVGHQAYRRHGQNRPDQAEYWTWILVGQQLVFSLIWNLPPIIFWSQCDDLGRMFMIMVYACNMAGGAAITSPCPPYAVISIVLSAVAIVIMPALEGTPFYIGIAALSVGFTFFMAHMARQVFLTARDMLLLREDKSELIEQLTAAKIESDKARHRAEAASQAKSEFLANMSHELRTPLNAILGFSEIMKGEVFGSLGSPQYIEYAGHIHGSGQHLLGLINDVLDLARIEAGRFVVRAIEINMRDAIANAATLFEVRAMQGKVDVKLEVENGLPLLLADERAMRQILLNLISNAVKFTPEGGTVTVFARRSGGGGMEFGVSDTGVGIDPADIDTVFEAFGQGQHDVATREKGTGLGLPIVRGLVEAHGGKVRLASELGKGTTVTCVFPRERLTAPQPVPIRLATVI